MKYPVLILLMAALSGCATGATPTLKAAYVPSAVRPLADAGWQLLSAKNYSEALTVAQQCIDAYGEKAAASNESCARTDGAVEVNCSFLNEVSECWGIKILVFKDTDQKEKIKNACTEVYHYYSNSMVWDPKGWFWTVPGLCDELMGKEAKLKTKE